MSTTATTLLPSGIYYIVATGSDFESLRLTDGENYVTILPPSVGNDPRQEVIHYFHDKLDCLSLTCPFT